MKKARIHPHGQFAEGGFVLVKLDLLGVTSVSCSEKKNFNGRRKDTCRLLTHPTHSCHTVAGLLALGLGRGR